MRIALLLLPIAVLAQTDAPAPRFEVASIKPNTSGDRYSRTNSDRGTVFFENVALLTIVRQAFNARDFEIVSPAWMEGERFDVTAKFREGASLEERKLMMQALLAERFHLQVHREKKMMPGFALKVAKNGPKIQPVEDKGERNANTSGGHWTMEQRPMDDVASQLTNLLRQRVQNETGLKGVYTFTLTYSPDRGLEAKDADPAGPSIFTALEEQLGLKLEARKVPVDVVVVDRCDKMPAEN